MEENLMRAAERIEMRLSTARMQLKRMPPAAPSRGHAGGIVAGLEEALELVRKSAN